MRPTLREIVVYAAGVAAAFAVDLALLAFLVEVASLQYLVAATASFIAGTLVVYWVSITHAFAYRRFENARSEFAMFALVGVMGILVNLAGMYVAVEHLHLHYMVGKLVSAGLTFFSNYGMRRVLLFTRWDRPSEQAQHRSNE